jgi:hypothetical protein
MTLFDVKNFSEIKEPGWHYNTLKPPLKFNEILLDFKYQWSAYSHDNLNNFKKVKFLILRIMQRFAYNLGWILATKQYKASSGRYTK